jgi:prepilin-type processing-associated H-X9-DG protein/prepilin-type N-terminal cleavage/methylation domain-containing protein
MNHTGNSGGQREKTVMVKQSLGFTVTELLAVVAVIGIIAALLLPTLGQGKTSARRTQCADNLRQMALGAHLYWNDHDDLTFRYLAGATNGGRVYWFGWIKPGTEGDRDFDPSFGALHEYLGNQPPGVCPSLDYQATIYKLKARAAICSYGYNRYLGGQSIPISRLTAPTESVLFADAAQVNDFQAPASPEHPLLEEFYYVDADEGSGYPNGHFRHERRAQAAFADGHVAIEIPVPNSFDPRLPGQNVGRLRAEILKVP